MIIPPKILRKFMVMIVLLTPIYPPPPPPVRARARARKKDNAEGYIQQENFTPFAIGSLYSIFAFRRPGNYPADKIAQNNTNDNNNNGGK